MLSVGVDFRMKSSSGIVHAFSFRPCFLFVSSPSQGPCCTAHCTFKLKTDKCRNDSDCAREGMCNGFSALCPASEPKPNFTDCNRNTQVCINGVRFCTVACDCSCLAQGVALWSDTVSILNGEECKINLFFNKNVWFNGFNQNNCEGTPNIKEQVANIKLALLFEKVLLKVFRKNQGYESVSFPSFIFSFFFSLGQVTLLP